MRCGRWRGLLAGSVCGWLFVSETLGGGAATMCGKPMQVVRRPVARAGEQLVIAPFAVPTAQPVIVGQPVIVAQPVAVVQFPQVFYAAGAELAQGVVRSETADAAHDGAAASDDVVTNDDREIEARGEAVSWVTQTCVRCHSGPTAEAGLDLSRPEQLSAAARLRAVQRVVSDDPAVRMPPAGGLEPATLGALVQELAETEEGP